MGPQISKQEEGQGAEIAQHHLCLIPLGKASHSPGPGAGWEGLDSYTGWKELQHCMAKGADAVREQGDGHFIISHALHIPPMNMP